MWNKIGFVVMVKFNLNEADKDTFIDQIAENNKPLKNPKTKSGTDEILRDLVIYLLWF